MYVINNQDLELNEIINGCKKNSLAHQKALYDLYEKDLFNLSLKYCSSFSDAEDNLQNAFIAIFTKINQYKGKGSFEGWMKRITINKAIDSYKNSYKLVPIGDKNYPDTEIEENDLDEYSIDYILALVQDLPNQYRLVFCLYELDSYSHAEIADMLKISTGTSKSNLHRAKMILKEQLKSSAPVHNINMKYGK